MCPWIWLSVSPPKAMGLCLPKSEGTLSPKVIKLCLILRRGSIYYTRPWSLRDFCETLRELPGHWLIAISKYKAYSWPASLGYSTHVGHQGFGITWDISQDTQPRKTAYIGRCTRPPALHPIHLVVTLDWCVASTQIGILAQVHTPPHPPHTLPHCSHVEITCGQ